MAVVFAKMLLALAHAGIFGFTLEPVKVPGNTFLHRWSLYFIDFIVRWTGFSKWDVTIALQAVATLILGYIVKWIVLKCQPDYPKAKVGRLPPHKRNLHALEGVLRRLLHTPHRE